MRRHACHLNRVDKMCLIIFRIAFLSIKFTIVVFQYIFTPLHTEKYQFSVMSVLYYNYYIKTEHSILYINLINTYQRIIENRTLSILNHHKTVGLIKAGIWIILAKLLQILLMIKNVENCYSVFQRIILVFSVVLFIIYCSFRLCSVEDYHLFCP